MLKQTTVFVNFVNSDIYYFIDTVTGISGDQSPSEKAVSIMAEIRALQDIIAKFKAMQIDPTEYACLKGIVIFKTGKRHLCNYCSYSYKFNILKLLPNSAQVCGVISFLFRPNTFGDL